MKNGCAGCGEPVRNPHADGCPRANPKGTNFMSPGELAELRRRPSEPITPAKKEAA